MNEEGKKRKVGTKRKKKAFPDVSKRKLDKGKAVRKLDKNFPGKSNLEGNLMG